MTPTTAQSPKNSIVICVVVHDDIPQSKQNTLYADHFRPLIKELESFTNRRFHVVFAGGKPYTTFDYKGDDELNILLRWETLGYKLLEEMRNEGLETNSLTKVVLVTNDMLNSRTAGIALARKNIGPGRFAIASLGSYLTVGHEVGHLLNATHEDYETQYNGWIAETYMAPSINIFTSNSYTFSPANRKNILNYLADKD